MISAFIVGALRTFKKPSGVFVTTTQSSEQFNRVDRPQSIVSVYLDPNQARDGQPR
jgi:hypothetical protein